MDQDTRFNKIFDSQYPKVYRLCKGYFNGNEDLASDAAQETFIRIWQKLDTFRNESSISTWIYRITVNTCLIHIRRRKKRREVPAENFDFSTKEGMAVEKEERLAKMYACIQKLKPPDRMVILMVLEDIKYNEIAQIIGVSEGALRVRIHRIKKRLTNCVQ